jgi:hypothetical protein
LGDDGGEACPALSKALIEDVAEWGRRVEFCIVAISSIE